MPAKDMTGGFKPATWGVQSIPEIGLASGTLSDKDCHFGVNADDKKQALIEALLPSGKKELAEFGPRAIDMAARNGIVAEYLWRKFRDGEQSLELTQFLITFEDIGSKPIRHATYHGGAMISGVPVDGKLKYGGTDKTMNSIDDAMDQASDAAALAHPGNKDLQNEFFAPTGLHKGTRWSKVSLEATLREHGRIHFHLDGMGDVQEICIGTGGDPMKGKGSYSHNVTSRELRYLYRNRDRFGPHATFYNGFDDSTGSLVAVIVKPPWEP